MIIVNSFTVQQPIKTDYRVYEEDQKPLITVVTKNNQKHPDYIQSLFPVYNMIHRFCGFDVLTKQIAKRTLQVKNSPELAIKAEAVMDEWDKLITLDKLIFPRSEKKGDGIKISFYFNIPASTANLKITTPVFWDNDLYPEEKTAIALMKEEAYAYAHEDKQAQTQLNFDDQEENNIIHAGKIETDVFKPLGKEEEKADLIPFKKPRKKKGAE